MSLTREKVLDAAEVLADRDELSLTALAAVLKIRTPSLYSHVEGIEELRRLLAERAVRQMQQIIERNSSGLSRQQAILAVARAIRAYAQKKPGLYRLAIGVTGQLSKELVESLQRVLAGYNLNDVDALHALRGLRSIVHGFIILEAQGSFRNPISRDESFERLLSFYLRGLDCS
jgi:AcrR family transcriptional regulator